MPSLAGIGRLVLALSVLPIAATPAFAREKKKPAVPPPPPNYSTRTPGEIELPELGLRLRTCPDDLQRPPSVSECVEVTAVRDRGPSYFAGLVPGHLLWGFLHKRNQNHLQFAQHFKENYNSAEPRVWVTFYSAEGFRSAYFHELTLVGEPPQPGKWFTDRMVAGQKAWNPKPGVVLPGMAEARAAAREEFERAKAIAAAKFNENPCSKHVDYKLDQMAEIKFGYREGPFDSKWREIACQNATDGGIPIFEATVLSLLARASDACNTPTRLIYNESDSVDSVRRNISRTSYEHTLEARRPRQLGKGGCAYDYIDSYLFEPEGARSAGMLPPPAIPPKSVRPAELPAAPKPSVEKIQLRPPVSSVKAPAIPPPSGEAEAPPVVAVSSNPRPAVPRTPMTPQTPAPALEKGTRGEIVWSGAVIKGGVITIGGGAASPGMLIGRLPGVPVTVRLRGGKFELTELPTEANQWKSVRLRSLADGRGRIQIEWTAK